MLIPKKGNLIPFRLRKVYKEIMHFGGICCTSADIEADFLGFSNGQTCPSSVSMRRVNDRLTWTSRVPEENSWNYYYYYYYIIIIIYYYYYWRKQITRGRYNTKLFLTLTPAGADSDLNATTTAPSQAEVTDLNSSDHSTTWSWMRVRWRLTKLWSSPRGHFFWSGRVVWVVKTSNFCLARRCRRSVQVRLCTSWCKNEKMFGIT